MKIKLLSIIFFLCFSGINSFSQTEIVKEKTTFVDTTGLLYWNKELPVYINLSSEPNEKGHNLKSKIHAKYTNPLYFDTEGINFIRTRYAVDKETHKTIVPQTELLFEVYADGISPQTKSEFTGAEKIILNNKMYYGKNLKIKLSSFDAGAGVNEIYYSFNSAPYVTYESEIVPDVSSGACELKFYAVDFVGNSEVVKKNTIDFIIDEDAPETFHTITGINIEKRIIALNTKIYMEASDAQSGLKATYYKFDEGPFIPYNGNILPLNQLSEDDHTLSYYSEDKVGNIENQKTFSFFLDKSAPILTSDVLGDRFVVNDQIYFSGRTKLKLTAIDNKSGVKDVKYSVDNSEFESYTNPFYLPKQPGYHIIKYYATDNTENNTGLGGDQYKNYKYSTKKIYVDLVGPTLSHQYIGNNFSTRDTVFLGKTSKIKLNATDSESGLQYISYALDGVQEETMYKEPFNVPGNGKHLVEYFGYDNVNNRNVSQFYVIVDENPPAPNYVFSVKPYRKENGIDVYPAYVLIYLSGIDQMTGTEQIYYSINGSLEKLYSSPLSGFLKGNNTLRFKTVDKLGNEQYSDVKFIIE